MSGSEPEALAVLVAAGSSRRMEGAANGTRKPLVELAGCTLLEHACRALAAAPSVRSIVVVAHPDDVETVQELVRQRPACAKVEAVVPGGTERADSVRLGVGASRAEIGLVCVHDAARPCVSTAAVERTLDRARESGAALLALALPDTLKRSEDGASVARTLDREGLFLAQTPQAFEAGRFREVLAQAERDSFRPTDDAALWERYVGPVAIVPGEPTNLKITRPADLELAAAILATRAGKEVL